MLDMKEFDRLTAERDLAAYKIVGTVGAIVDTLENWTLHQEYFLNALKVAYADYREKANALVLKLGNVTKDH